MGAGCPCHIGAVCPGHIGDACPDGGQRHIGAAFGVITFSAALCPSPSRAYDACIENSHVTTTKDEGAIVTKDFLLTLLCGTE